MHTSAVRRRLADGRWHFQHGPIDLVIACEGSGAACDAAVETAWTRFQGVLDELAPQLAVLRSPVPAAAGGDGVRRGAVFGPIAAAMVEACRPFGEQFGLFVTPMAAVAGSVADEMAAAFLRPGIDRAYVNNGGDIALCLAAGRRYDVGIVANLQWPRIDGHFTVGAESPVRGIATSGWRGRSFSLGIADSVTVLARTGAAADAAATLVANRVNVESPAVQRRPASMLRDDSDLGERLVTVGVERLTDLEIQAALDEGAAFAEILRRRGLIEAAALSLGDQVRVVRSR
jgi:uncharacterized protein